MPYVQRDASGAIIGAFDLPQPGYATEWIANDDPSLAATFNPISDRINGERDRRISSLFSYGGKNYQLDPESQINVTAMGARARFAMNAGAVAGNLRWIDPNNDFGWIATDNTVTLMDAPTMAAMSDAALLWKSQNTFAAHSLKGMSPIPTNFTSDTYWPKPN